MRHVSVREAAADLPALLKAAQAGEEVRIAQDGGPSFRLVPVAAPPGRRPLGTVAGEIWIGPDFDAPLPPEERDAFEGRGPE